jgi:hypothetical protein
MPVPGPNVAYGGLWSDTGGGWYAGGWYGDDATGRAGGLGIGVARGGLGGGIAAGRLAVGGAVG